MVQRGVVGAETTKESVTVGQQMILTTCLMANHCVNVLSQGPATCAKQSEVVQPPYPDIGLDCCSEPFRGQVHRSRF